jgi:dTDP-3-amino-3,4,6-trideoxy-alpha-D-glucose transaminase
VKFFDLTAANEELSDALDSAYGRVMKSGWVILGPELELFESEFAAFCEASHCIGVGNGLDALALALRARGIGAGDEVIVPSHTFIATWLAVSMVGARPIPVEVDAATFTMDVRAAAAAVTPKTAAIIPVSLYGHPVDMDPILALAERHGLFVLEDAAQAHGARHRGRRTGSLAHATAFSFYPTKNLGALGDGGAVVTSDPVLADQLRVLRNYGSREKYIHIEAGVNSRLDELQAAFLRTRLAVLDGWNEKRRTLADSYRKCLAGVPDLVAPSVSPGAEHVYHLYVVRLRDRDRLIESMRAEGISTLIHYPVPCHLQQAFSGLGFKRGMFPIAEKLAEEVISLPMWPQMPTDAPGIVATAIKASAKKAKVA